MITYKEDLMKIELHALREIVVQVFRKIKESGKERSFTEIKNTVDKLRGKNRESGQTYTKCLSGAVLKKIVEKRWEDQKNEISGNIILGFRRSCTQEILANYLLFFYEKYDIKWDINGNTFESKLDGEDYYDMFYWRQDGFGNDTVGVARIKIFNDWKDVKLRLFFHSKTTPYADLEGTATFLKGNLYISLIDKTIINNQPDIKSNASIILYNVDRNKDNILFGCILSSNRLREVPIASIILLTKGNSQGGVLESDFISAAFETDGRRKTTKIDDRITYYLSGRQIRVEEKGHTKIVEDLSILPGFEDYNKIMNLQGTYQSFNFSTNTSKNSLRSFIIDINASGIAYIRKLPLQKFGEGDVGRARILKNDTQDKLLLQFDYSPTSRCYNYSLLLEKNKENDLSGIFFGLIDSQIASGRVYLKATEKESKPLGIREITNENPISVLSELRGCSSDVIDFFSNDRFDSFTDAGFKNFLQNQNLLNTEPSTISNKLPPNCYGLYKCYFPTKLDSKNPYNHDASSYGLVLNILPLLITDNSVKIKIGAEIITGSYIYDDANKVMLIFNSTRYLISILFYITEIENIDHIYATFNQIGNSQRVESSACIMINQNVGNPNFEFSKINLRHEIKVKVEDMIPIEQETKGAITKIVGSWNRTLLLKENNNVLFTPRQKAYRRTFWFAALNQFDVFFKTKDINYLTEAFECIKRAYNHGFAMKYFSVYQYDDKLGHFNYDGLNNLNLRKQIQYLEEEIKMVQTLLYAFDKDIRFVEILDVNNRESDDKTLLSEIHSFLKKYFVR